MMLPPCGFRFEKSYLQLPDIFYTRLHPIAVPAPERVVINPELALELGLDFSSLSEEDQAALFSGNRLPAGAEPIAQAYAGHQFGHFTLLGDGRSLVWGEHTTPHQKKFDLQWKGSGPTPYSRGGDGKAALGPMLREYLISEAMHHLGIPTTRSLAVVKTGETVIREKRLPGAILTRVAQSHIRVGTFEFAASHPDQSLLPALLNYTIRRHDPHLISNANQALAFLKAVMQRQVDLVVHWMRVGFIHGVMNTDNMAVSGETLDYGPCAFLDVYHPGTVFSSIDHLGRYAYSSQPHMAGWNIARLAESLLKEIHPNTHQALEMAQETVKNWGDLYQVEWVSMMRQKLGLFGTVPDDELLIAELLDWMQKNQADFTYTFRQLSQVHHPIGKIYEQESFVQWYTRWQERLKRNEKPIVFAIGLMQKTNPAIIPRNHQVEHALQTASHADMQAFHELLCVLKKPYEDDPTLDPAQAPPQPHERIHQTFCGT